jgi:uncharacterized protein (DUF2267 family)
MSATGLDVVDKSLQSTHAWLDQITARIGPDRQLAWRVLGTVLHAVRDRLPLELAAHLGAQLPLLVRGLYYDQWQPAEAAPRTNPAREDFLAQVAVGIPSTRPVNIVKAVHAVFGVLDRSLDPGQVRKIRRALPQDIRELWPETGRSEGRSARSAA